LPIRWAIVAKATSQGAGMTATYAKSRFSALLAGGIAFASDDLLPFSAANHERR
jgi:hypothetical protein